MQPIVSQSAPADRAALDADAAEAAKQARHEAATNTRSQQSSGRERRDRGQDMKPGAGSERSSYALRPHVHLTCCCGIHSGQDVPSSNRLRDTLRCVARSDL